MNIKRLIHDQDFEEVLKKLRKHNTDVEELQAFKKDLEKLNKINKVRGYINE